MRPQRDGLEIDSGGATASCLAGDVSSRRPWLRPVSGMEAPGGMSHLFVTTETGPLACIHSAPLAPNRGLIPEIENSGAGLEE
jgi:hypothetical protein